ncbi:hypothetical protein FPV67DRAFT_1433640 [Lyophyllum atratum]|nr:hypothetical protein FPV67DRAFT_1433640 [Lyophyllum atratum]
MSTSGPPATLSNYPFSLPNTTGRGPESYAISSGIVHSGQFNIRGLECHSYGTWNEVLQDLIAHLPPTVVLIPQFELDVFQVEHDDTISVSDSISSLAQPDARGLIPDFTIVVTRAILRDSGVQIGRGTLQGKFVPWIDLRIEALRPGLIAEVKRRPTRSARTAQRFASDLGVHLLKAKSALALQAKEAFRAHYETKRIILLALVGDWFAWKLAVCEDYHFSAGTEPRPRRAAVPKANNDASGTQDQPPASPPHAAVAAPMRPQAENQVVPPPLGPRAEFQRVAKTKAAAKGYADPAPPQDDPGQKLEYNRNMNPKPRSTDPKPQEEGTLTNTVKLAEFRHYEPADIAAFNDVQLPLTDTQLANKELFRQPGIWSGAILLGTQDAAQNWYMIHRFLEDANTSLNAVGVNDDNDQSGVSQSLDIRMLFRFS